MKRAVGFAAVVVTVLGGLLPASAAQDEARPPRAIEIGRGPVAVEPGAPPTSIRLQAGSIDTAVPQAGISHLSSLPGGVLAVQFDGPVTDLDRRALEEAGAEILSILPDHAYAVRIADPAALRAVVGIRWVGGIEPALRVHPGVTGSDAIWARVIVYPGGNPEAVATAATDLGATVLIVADRGLLVSMDGTQAQDLAGHQDVAWVEPSLLRETHNEYGGGIIGAPAAHAAGYNGSTQIVAVADTGLGDGTPAGAPRDIPAERIVGVDSYSTSDLAGCWTVHDDGARDVDSGHGTHVAGSVLSDGGPSGEGLGAAPGAALYFQAVEEYIDFNGLCGALPQYVDGYYLFGIPEPLDATLFQDAYNAGARVHSDSWGSDAAGDYTDDSAVVDDFMWDNPDFLVVTSAGNAGVDTSPADGAVDADSIGSPATAKNVLTVGASENDRPDDFPCDLSLAYTNPTTGLSCQTQATPGTNDIFTLNEAWEDDFAVAPLANDPSAGNAEQMAAFSSRGPTDDGRIKPDVVAPGTWVLSGYSSLYQEGYGTTLNPQNGAYQYDGWGFPIDEHYKYMGGTSMSAPLVSGAAAVVRDFYEQAHGHGASAALVKATLINSAVDLLDENNDGADDNDHPIPNHHEGWGRIDVAAAVDGSHAFFDDTSVTTGTQVIYAATVEPSTALRISLVWTDAASTASSGVNLVNDLDLVVTAPDGPTVYLGNNFAGGWTQAGTLPFDRVNNVENVYVENPVPGTWTIQVFARETPAGPQPFAMVVDGALDVSAVSQWPSGASLETVEVLETTLRLQWPAAIHPDGIAYYTVFRDGVSLATVDGNSFDVTGLLADTEYSFSVVPTDSAGIAGTPLNATVRTARDFADTNGHLFEEDIAWLSGRGITQGCDDAGNFCPAESMTRAQMASLLARALELSPIPGERFSDVSGVHAENINAVAAAGITLGCDPAGTLFCPSASVTRAQMAAFLDRAFALPATGEDFFTDDAGSVHEGSINAVAAAGITLGCADGLFCPEASVSRGQIAAFIHRAFTNLE